MGPTIRGMAYFGGLAPMKIVMEDGRIISVSGRRTRRIILWLISRMEVVEREKKLQVIANLAGDDLKPRLVIFDDPEVRT